MASPDNWTLRLVNIFLISFITLGCNRDEGKDEPAEENVPKIETPEQVGPVVDTTILEITARELAHLLGGGKSSFEEDANQGTKFQIRGKIREIGPGKISDITPADPLLNIIWLYADSREFQGEETVIACELHENGEEQYLTPGREVSIQGVYRSWSGSTIHLSECIVVKPGERIDDPNEEPKLWESRELRELSRKLDQFTRNNQKPMFLSEDPKHRLYLEFFSAMFMTDPQIPNEVINTLEVYPIEVLHCPGSAAGSLLQHLGSFPRLRQISFDGLLGCGAEDLKKLSDLKFLKTLQFHSCSNLDDEMSKILSGLKGLRELEIRECSLTDPGIASFGKLRRLERLQILAPIIGDPALAGLVALSRLRWLELSCGTSRVTDAGLVDFAKNSKAALIHLDLTGHAGITDQGIESLVKSGLKIYAIDLAETSVTDKGLLLLAEKGSVRKIINLPPQTTVEGHRALERAGVIPPATIP